jgi:hypothetical protein
MSTRCNTRLQPPRCEQLYCGTDGTACDQDVECVLGATCVDGACHGGPPSAQGLGGPCEQGTASPPQIVHALFQCTTDDHLCLTNANGLRRTCTALCSADADCAGADTSQCGSGFVCTAVTATGEYACQKLCVCRDDVQPISCP